MIKKLFTLMLCMIFLVASVASASAFLPPGTGGGLPPTLPPVTPPTNPPSGGGDSTPSDVVGPIVLITSSSTNLPANSSLTISANVADTGGYNTGVSYFKIKENGAEIYSKNCNNAASCDGSVTVARAKGTYTYTVEAKDAADNFADSQTTEPDFIQVIFTNRNPLAPVLVSPANDSLVLTSNPSLTWNAAIDPDGDHVTYDVEIDGTITNVDTLVSNSTLTEGNHLWRVRSADIENNVSAWTETRTVRVDTLYPQVTLLNVSNIELGSNENVLIDVVEANLQTVRIEINGLANYSMTNLAGTVYAYTITSPSLGTHSLRFYAQDVANRINSTVTASFNVTDTTSPVFNPVPSSQISELGQPFAYDINATDLSLPIIYNITDNANFTIDSEGTIRNSTFLPLGIYSLSIVAKDAQNNSNTPITITVTIQDTTAPIFNPVPASQTIEFGNSFLYDLNAFDLQSITYAINASYGNGTMFSIDANGTIINTTALTVGNYTMQIAAQDASANTITAIIDVFVTDTVAPVWVNASNQTTVYNESFSYQVVATDLQTITYTISDIINFAINAISGLITNILSLNPGEYDLEVNATDASGNVNSKFLTVTVTDPYAPEAFNLISPVNNTVSKNTTPLLTWQQSNEDNFGRYIIGVSTNPNFLDEEVETNDTAIYDVFNQSQTSLQVSLQNDTTYYWTVVAVDSSENYMLSNNVFTYTTDNTAPNIILVGFLDNGCDGGWTFSPNGDGVCENVTIQLGSSETLTEWVSIKIYNQENNSIYKYYFPSDDNTSPINQTWDGSLTAGTLTNGYYALQIKIRDSVGNEKTEIRTGAVLVDNVYPIYTGISITPSTIYGDTNVKVDVNVTEGNIDNVSLWHNATGTWQSYPAETVSEYGEYGYTISNSLLEGGETVGWYLTATDTAGNLNSTAISTFYVNNYAPAVSTIPSQTWNEDTVKTINLKSYFSDQDGDTLTFSSTTPANIAVSINQTTGIATLTPNTNWNGVDYINFTASDAFGSVTSNQVTLNVANVNDAPTLLSNIPNQNENEDFGTVIVDANLSDNVMDIDGDTDLLFSIISENANEVDCAINEDGTNLSITSVQNWNGLASCSVRVSDRKGGVFYTPFNITVNPVNDAPILMTLQNKSVNKDRLFTYDIDASDVDNDALTFSDNATQFIINANTGLISFIPAVEEVIDVQITVCDNVTVPACANSVFTLTVNPPISNITNSYLESVYYSGNLSYNTTGVYSSDIIDSSITGIINVSGSTIRNSTLVNSTANNCIILDSVLYGIDCLNQVIDPSDVRYSNVSGSNITDSHIWNSNATNSVFDNAVIDNSAIDMSIVTNSTFDNVTMTNSVIINSDTIVDTVIDNASITNNTITSGTIIMTNGTLYDVSVSGPKALKEIVNFKPTADFSYSAAYLVVTFVDLSSDLNVYENSTLNDSLTYLWNFGDSTASTTANALHTYSSAGTFTVILTVTDKFNESNSKSMTITLTAQPSVSSYSSSGGSGGSCLPRWTCTEWSACSIEGKQTRTCTDSLRCGVSTGKPTETQTCTYVAPVVAKPEENKTTTPTAPVANATANQTAQEKGTAENIMGITGKAIDNAVGGAINFGKNNPIPMLIILAALITFIVFKLATPKNKKKKKNRKNGKKNGWKVLEEEEENVIPVHHRVIRHVKKHAKRAHEAIKRHVKNLSAKRKIRKVIKSRKKRR